MNHHINPIQETSTKPCFEEVSKYIESIGFKSDDAEKLAVLITQERMARGPSQSPYVTNTRVMFPSAKMGVTVNLESFGIEYARALQLEFDPSILYYATQPVTLSPSWHDSAGKLRRGKCTPDFLVVSTTDVWFEETKPAERFEKRVKQSPTYYLKDGEQFRYVPGKHNEYKLPCHCVTDQTLPRKMIRNYEFLLAGYYKRALNSGDAWCDESDLDRIKKAFLQSRSYSISELADAASVDKLNIYRAIGAGDLCFLIVVA